MKPFKIEDLQSFNPAAKAQLLAAGVDLSDEPVKVFLDSKGNELKPSELEEIAFKLPVEAIPFKKGKKFIIGGLGEFYKGKKIDWWYDNHSETSGWVVYEIPFVDGNKIVTTSMSNIVGR